MDSASHLLSQLRIDRNEVPKPSSGSWRPRSLVLPVIAALVIGAVVWWASAEPARMSERVAAEPVAHSMAIKPSRTALAPARAAALDTSGYVVARRQATVSSKATGRVAEVLTEEGQRVEQGQIIARLDSSNTGAALAEAQARLALAQAEHGARNPVGVRHWNAWGILSRDSRGASAAGGSITWKLT